MKRKIPIGLLIERHPDLIKTMPFITIYNPGADSASVTFKTHLNYIKCMNMLTNSLAININVQASSSLDANVFSKFERLNNITKTSILGEKTACDNERAYAQVAAPWIPVKCYYRLYYLESVFMYLLNGSRAGFSQGGHTKVRSAIRTALENGDITLSGSNATELAIIQDWSTANSFRTVSGSTIRANYHATTDCAGSLRKKLAEYIEIDWKLKNKITNYRTVVARTKKNNDLLPKKFGLLDYFFWMRIKANYRDVDFLDFDKFVNEADAYEYLSHYIKSADQYANALSTSIVALKSSRGL